MAHVQVNGFRELLARKAVELAGELRRRDALAFEQSAEQMDAAQFACEREVALRIVDRESAQLREVKAALLRVRAGRFGMCVECDSPIGVRRLAAVPWASRCIACQDVFDRDLRLGAEPLSAALVEAV